MTIDEPSGPRVYPGVEHGKIAVPLDDLLEGHEATVFPEAEKRGLFAVRLEKGKLIFTATNHVGLIPINDRIFINVRPKLPVSNLTRLLALSGVAPLSIERFSRDYVLSDEPIPLLLDLFTKALLAGMDEVRHHGLLREYQNLREDTSFPRGRLLVGPTMQRHAARNVTHRVTTSVFHRTTDNGPNRLLKYAIWHLSQVYRSVMNQQGGAKKTLNKLNEAYTALDGVALDHRHEFFEHHLVQNPVALPAIRDYYREPINLSKAVLTNRGVSLEASDEAQVALPTLLLNMDTVFEQYARTVIRRGMAGRTDLVVADGNVRGAGGARKKLFDTDPSDGTAVDAAPDVVIHAATSPSDRPIAVIDLKYKQAPAREDVNQLIAYSASFRSKLNFFIHPTPEKGEPGLHEHGRIDDKVYYAYSMNLGAKDLPAEEDRLLDTIKKLLQL